MSPYRPSHMLSSQHVSDTPKQERHLRSHSLNLERTRQLPRPIKHGYVNAQARPQNATHFLALRVPLLLDSRLLIARSSTSPHGKAPHQPLNMRVKMLLQPAGSVCQTITHPWNPGQPSTEAFSPTGLSPAYIKRIVSPAPAS